MEHPGLNITEIKQNLTLEEVQGKLRDLNSRMTFAYNTNNQPLINQLAMAIETYTRAQNEMLDDMFGGGGDDSINLDDQIDIS